MYVNEAKDFAIQLPPAGWSVQTGKEPDLLLRHAERAAGMSVHATCGEVPRGRRPEIVSRHLYFGIQGKEILRQERRAASPEEALEVVLRGQLEGQELLLHGYTVVGRDCVYDLVLFAAPKDYSQVNGDFEALVHSFRRLREETR